MNTAQTKLQRKKGGWVSSSFTFTLINIHPCFMISMGTWCEWCLENRRYTLCCSHIKEQQNTKGPLWRNCRAARMVCSFEPQPRTFTYAKLSTVLLIMCYTYLCLKLTTDQECNIQFYSFFFCRKAKNYNLCFCLCTTGEKDAPAVLHPTVQLAGGEVAVQKEIKGGATGHIGHAVGTKGRTLLLYSGITEPCALCVQI